ncbi:hypothetical protein [Stieleria varia]|uniref:Uncharacterized protein n=1 Tax=Stieleria varia TaxID=2528005 RepID=A0A5C6AT89_9BACT|nr:hypothetical protein [Stieleria varia]TWU02286.1 hypothetical protein Pla52n_33360 [Stieleria varia]
MSVRKLTASLLTALLMLSGFATASVSAQEHFPAADPLAFDPDFRWFEPIYDMDLADLKPKHRANTGWFATYDRLNLYGSRPELNDPQVAETKLDSGWGHRYEIGYMLPDVDSGWLFSSVQSGVGEFFTVARERVNRVNEDGFQLGDGLAGPPFGFIVPAADDNTPGLNTRTYFVQDTENVFSFNSYELSKTWRMEPYHYGGIMEPMVGLRWFRIEDLDSRQNYISSLDIDQSIGGNPPLSEFGDAVEQLTTNQSVTQNDTLTAQLGFRYTKFRDRFTFSSDFRAFAGHNWQCAYSTTATEITIYDGTGVGSEVDNILYRQTRPIYERNEEFVVGFDVRGEVGYQVSKMIKVRTGFQLIDMARGIWRGGSSASGVNPLGGGDNDQDLLLVGATFGIELNR